MLHLKGVHSIKEDPEKKANQSRLKYGEEIADLIINMVSDSDW